MNPTTNKQSLQENFSFALCSPCCARMEREVTAHRAFVAMMAREYERAVRARNGRTIAMTRAELEEQEHSNCEEGR